MFNLPVHVIVKVLELHFKLYSCCYCRAEFAHLPRIEERLLVLVMFLGCGLFVLSQL